ncbi:class I adenylate-forming enzyme family protein [Nocardia caishijiensis]|uniref:Acyl-CoA synthetase (AMP-forming)/AMP-acid ligase II n=1 Tax=Nocardia caishijiensis TaxID=184756 RepID=A0ABQ6YLA3_9NOCA|nr:class I adenylate-forming enzyme family protein [Nocardia caishijiensis]KAF0846365.1 acyl-CoA synthetase (AMP-forming)/AMP-acid ligase II [Nocardia caishijiensis]
MTDAVDPQVFVAQVAAGLTAPGAPFEMTVEEVLGAPVPVFRHRRRSLRELLELSLNWGERDYLVTEDRRISFAEHAAAVGALATALAERYGVGKGDRVAILAANGPDWVVTFWAAQCLGAVPVGYNAWWAPPEIAYALGHTTPTVVVADGKRTARLREAGGEVPVLTFEADLPALIAEYRGAKMPETEVAEDDPAVILYTSGTSGRAKGVVHTQRNLVAITDYHRFTDAMQAAFTGRELGHGPSERRYLVTAPLFHIASLHNLVIPRLATGAAAVFPHGAFDVDRVLSLVQRERVTNWAAVPTMATRLLDHDVSGYDLSTLAALSLNSAPSAPALLERLREHLAGVPLALTTSYGLTESGTAATVATPLDLLADAGSVGRPIIGVSVEIRDPDGVVSPDGVEGEIFIRSQYVMLGYWDDEAATAEAVDDQRWLRSGDFGTMTDGRLTVSGRRTDLILRGGENVYPTEVENVLCQHPSVTDCAVFGVPDPDLGHTVAAVVVAAPGTVEEGELRDFLAARLAYFKVPARWRITADALPRNATGKVTRRDLAL